jgi:hypothetical protein
MTTLLPPQTSGDATVPAARFAAHPTEAGHSAQHSGPATAGTAVADAVSGHTVGPRTGRAGVTRSTTVGTAGSAAKTTQATGPLAAPLAGRVAVAAAAVLSNVMVETAAGGDQQGCQRSDH